MKKLVFILFLVGLCSQSHDLYSQNSRIKFVGLTLLLANHASVSYEYAFTKHHAIGLQFHGYLTINPMAYYMGFNRRIGINLNYRYYFFLRTRVQFFAQIEAGYANYSYGNTSKQYQSKEIGGGPLFGLRKSIGSTHKWFVDLAIGFNFISRDYTKVDVDWNLICEGNVDCIENHYTIEMPEDRNFYKPRIMLEFGFKF